EANLVKARTVATNDARNAARLTDLHGRELIAAMDLDNAKTNAESSQASLAAAEAQLAAARSQIDTQRSQVPPAQSNVDAARARLRRRLPRAHVRGAGDAHRPRPRSEDAHAGRRDDDHESRRAPQARHVRARRAGHRASSRCDPRPGRGDLE